MIDMKKCPFCGTKPELVSANVLTKDSSYTQYSIRCKVCGCTMDFSRNNTLYWSDKEAKYNVISRWNDREG